MAANPRTRRRDRAADRGRPRRRIVEPVEPVAPPPQPPPVEPPPGGDWRENVIGLSGLNVLAGIWLIIAPWVLGYSAADPRWNDVVFGAIVAVFALVRAAGGFREAWLSWINALIGIWLFVAAWTIDVTGTAGANDVILGAIVFILAVGSAASTPLLRRGTGAGR